MFSLIEQFVFDTTSFLCNQLIIQPIFSIMSSDLVVFVLLAKMLVYGEELKFTSNNHIDDGYCDSIMNVKMSMNGIVIHVLGCPNNLILHNIDTAT